jgi:hypothetical protein
MTHVISCFREMGYFRYSSWNSYTHHSTYCFWRGRCNPEQSRFPPVCSPTRCRKVAAAQAVRLLQSSSARTLVPQRGAVACCLSTPANREHVLSLSAEQAGFQLHTSFSLSLRYHCRSESDIDHTEIFFYLHVLGLLTCFFSELITKYGSYRQLTGLLRRGKGPIATQNNRNTGETRTDNTCLERDSNPR